MKKISFICIHGLFALFFFSSCSDESEKEQPVQPSVSQENTRVLIPLTPEEQAMPAKSNGFAMKLLNSLLDKTQIRENVFLSPISVVYALGMLNELAASESKQEIAKVLGFDQEDGPYLTDFCFKMLSWSPQVDRTVSIGAANMIVTNSLYKLDFYSNYKECLHDNYEARVESMDFSSAGTLDDINHWCSEHTGRQITKMLDRLDGRSTMVLLNASHFKGAWSTPFDKSQTSDENFMLENGTVRKVKMMKKKAPVYGGIGEHCYYVSVPFGNQGYSMVLALPFEGLGVREMVGRLTEDDVKEMCSPMGAGVNVEVWLPRFSVEWGMNMKEILQDMGLPMQIDMTGAADGLGFQQIGTILQKATIKVDEGGAEASAATDIEMAPTSAGPLSDSTNPEFHCDRPFLYLIVEKSTGAIFFMGTYMGE